MILTLIASAANTAATTTDAELHSMPLLEHISLAGIAILIICVLLCLWRVVKGPHLADRALASDAMALSIAALVILMTVRLQNANFLDVALLVILLGFAGTVAMSQFIASRHKHLNQEPHKEDV